MKQVRGLKDEAVDLMGGRISVSVFPEKDRALIREMCECRSGKKKIGQDGVLSMAQAIVLVQGVKALQGDKSAAEFLQKLSDGREHSAENEKEESRVTVQVKWVE